MTLREGRNRQIREMAVRVGLDVIRLVRVRIGSVLLGNLKPGEWRELSNVEVRRLKVITNVGQKANLPGGRKSA